MVFKSRKHGGTVKRGGWRHRKVRSVQPGRSAGLQAEAETCPVEAVYGYSLGDDSCVAEPQEPVAIGTLQEMARLLWEPDY